jgi:hypothetical protein
MKNSFQNFIGICLLLFGPGSLIAGRSRGIAGDDLVE